MPMKENIKKHNLKPTGMFPFVKRRPSVFKHMLSILLYLAILPLFQSAANAQNSDDTPFVLNDFIQPEYGKHSSDVPEMMIYGKKATTAGVLVYLEDLRIEWLEDAPGQIKAAVTTSYGIYDKSTKIMTGDKDVHFVSDSMTVDGVGFTADQQKKTIHINSNVKVVLTGDLKTLDQKMKDGDTSNKNTSNGDNP
jgi:hypothetical protein